VIVPSSAPPATTADSLLREAINALETCLATLADVDERARALGKETDSAHRLMRRHLYDFAFTNTASSSHDLHLPARLEGGLYAMDHEAIYRDELALQQTMMRLHALQNKLDYLTNLVRSGKAQVMGSDGEALASTPWAAAVRAARIEAQEEERMRLAREVHDGPAQVLANTIFGLQVCEQIAKRSPAELGAELERLRAAMREGLIEVRRFMFDLRPTMLASMGLKATLAHYVEEYQRAFAIPVTLTMPTHDLAIDDSAQIVIFRVVQESLQNIHKHAGASAIWIDLTSQADGAVALRVRDDGAGFDLTQQRPSGSSGGGLLGMEERAALLDGQLEIESTPGQGTTITLSIPPRLSQPRPIAAPPPPTPLKTSRPARRRVAPDEARAHGS
jgi:two-component system sensor histidine kinase DegS